MNEYPENSNVSQIPPLPSPGPGPRAILLLLSACIKVLSSVKQKQTHPEIKKMIQKQEEVDQTRKAVPLSSDLESEKHVEVKDKNSDPHTSDYTPYPKLDPQDVDPPLDNWANVSMGSTTHSNPPGPTKGASPIARTTVTTMPADPNPYVSPAPVAPSSSKSNLLHYSFLNK